MTNSSVFLPNFWLPRHLQRFRRIFLQRWCSMTKLRIHFLSQSLSPFFFVRSTPYSEPCVCTLSPNEYPAVVGALVHRSRWKEGKKRGQPIDEENNTQTFYKKNLWHLHPQRKDTATTCWGSNKLLHSDPEIIADIINNIRLYDFFVWRRFICDICSPNFAAPKRCTGCL